MITTVGRSVGAAATSIVAVLDGLLLLRQAAGARAADTAAARLRIV